MATERTCAECGAPLPANAPGKRCPKCLLQFALEGTATESSPPKPQNVGVPALAETVVLSQPDALTERIGTTIGPYKLLQQIGEGGFGIVFMAEQTEPVQRKVALKVIKAGMDTREIFARFEAERQALALMDHPNIARVLDGGATAGGRPYFVMELVRGVPITDYCDHANLGTGERLGLFIKVCRAVQHAHQKGVIHRDLKPSNVMVTLHDGEPVPKVIDFGVAKALGQKLTDKTLFTRFEQLIGTPAYMSPEQAALSGLDIDTRSDVYSLGVLLYELLTGVTPLDEQTLRQGALDEIRRMIRETDPPKPSTRLLTLGDRLAEVARHRHAEPAALSRLIRGDLDWITMKALEKERQRRYETVNGLAADIERHLRNEPVVARAASALYRFQKTIRRHRITFAAGTAVVIALVFGAIISTWQAVRATRAEREQSKLRQQAQNAQASEATQRQRAEQNAENEARQRAQAEEMLTRLEIQNAEQLFAADAASAAMAHLARVLRQHPTNRVAAERLMAALVQRSFLLPATAPLQHKAEVKWAQFSPDGQQLVTASLDKTAQIWDARTGEPLIEFKLDGGGYAAEFSPDGQTIVTGDDRGNAQIWDANSGKPLGDSLKHRAGVNCAQFSPDGERIVTAAGHHARVWDVRSRQLLIEMQPHRQEILSALFSPDGEKIVTASFDGTAQIFDARTGQPIGQPFKHRQRLWSAQFSLDGERILTAGGHVARVFDVRSGRLLTKTVQQLGEVYFARFSPDGQQILTSDGNKSVRFWDAYTGQSVAEPIFKDRLGLPAQFSPDGQRVVTLSVNAAQVWCLPLARPLAMSLKHDPQVSRAQFSRDGKWLLTTGGDAAQVWDVSSGQLVSGPFKHGRAEVCSEFSPDGRWVVTGSWDHTARVWDARTGQPSTAPFSNSTPVSSVQFSPDSQWVLSSSSDGRIWDARTGQCLIELKHGRAVAYAQFSPDGKTVVTCSRDEGARLWDARTGNPLFTLQNKGGVEFADFSPDGLRVVTASLDKTARIWDAGTGRPLTKPLQHQELVNSARFSPNGQWVVTASDDHTARVWDSRTGEPLGEPLRHSGGVRLSAVFSPDGQKVVTAGVSQTAKVWDALTGQPLVEPLQAAPDSDALWAEFSPDGRWLVTAGGTARIWEVPLAPTPVPLWLAELAEAVAGLRFTAQKTTEWVAAEECWQLKRRLAESAGDDFYARWARWFFTDPATRTLSPSSSMTVPEHVQRCIRADTLESLQEATRLSPTNQLALARLARKLVAQEPAQGLYLKEKADALIRRAVELAPTDPEALRGRAEILEGTGRVSEALATLSKAVELVGTAAGSETNSRADFLLARSGLLKRMGSLMEAQRDFFEAKNIPVRGLRMRRELIDLSAYYNAAITQTWHNSDSGNDLAALPRGLQQLNGIDFDIRAIIQLDGANPDLQQGYPREVSAVQVGMHAKALHFLHAYGWVVRDGERVGEYLIHFRNGEKISVPLVSAENIRPWWHLSQESTTFKEGTTVAWHGQNSVASRAGYDVLLYNFRWQNPYPDLEIASIDFKSAMTLAAPFLVAITAE